MFAHRIEWNKTYSVLHEVPFAIHELLKKSHLHATEKKLIDTDPDIAIIRIR